MLRHDGHVQVREGSLTSILQNIGATPLFRGVNLEPLKEKLADWCHIYQDDQALFHQGESAECLVVLLSGSVAIRVDSTYIRTRTAPEILGELRGAGGPKNRTASATAIGIVSTVEIPRAIVTSLHEDAQFLRNLLEILSSKLAEATSDRGVHYANEGKLIAAFSSHLSPSLTARLIASGEDFGKPREITGTVLFADIRGFTDKSAAMQPADVARDLGAYLTRMVFLLHKHGAFVDKFIGDAVMAVWGTTDHDKDDPSVAFDCAMEMIRESSMLQFGGKPIEIGVGLAQGTIFCGNVGSDLKKQFTVLGSAVNLSARCESLCKELDASLVISDVVARQLREDQRAKCTHRPQHPVKGLGPLDLFSCSRQER